MKVLMLTDYYPPHQGGGVEKVVYEISKRLVRLGCEVSVITLNTRKARQFEVMEGVRIYRMSSIDLTDRVGAQLAVSLDAVFNISRIMKKENPDVLNAHNTYFFMTQCTAATKCMVRKPLVVTAHLGQVIFQKRFVNTLVRMYESTLNKWILGKSNSIIAVSEAVKQHVIHQGAKASKVSVVPNGVDLGEFTMKQKTENSSTCRILSVGRLTQNKGLRYLVDAAPRVLSKYPTTEFIIVGNGPMKQQLVNQARLNGVARNFSFIDSVPKVSTIMRDCDVFVRPSLTEGMPLTVLEAMATGLPTVATRVAGTPEIVIDYETGILVSPCDSRDLADSIMELLENPKLATKLGHNARSLVEKRHSWEKIAEMTLQTYRKILADPSAYEK